jgi:hypothetical protein
MTRGKSYERFVLIPAVPDGASNANKGSASGAVPMELPGASFSTVSSSPASAAAIIAPTASSSASSASSSSAASASSSSPKRRLSEPHASGEAADRSSEGGKKKARIEDVEGGNEKGAREDKGISALM